MEKLEALLERWHAQDAEDVPLGKLKVDPAFQPRDLRVVPFAVRDRMEAEAERHIGCLAAALHDGQLDPMLAARVDGMLYVVDGHHRLKAYRRAGKRTAAARVLPMERTTAVLASKLVNCAGVKLPMHAEQARECAWQYLAAVTHRGTLPLPEGLSRRSVARTFGTTRDTVIAMLNRLPSVDPRLFSHDACDPGTHWPRWKYVKGNAIRDRFADVPQDARQQAAIERAASKVAAMLDAMGRGAALRVVALVKDEAVAQAFADMADTATEAFPEY